MIFAAVVEQMSQKQVLPSGPVVDLETPQLVQQAAESVERLLARMSTSPDSRSPAALSERATVLDEMRRWRGFGGGSVGSLELGASAATVRATTHGPAQTFGDHDTLARACVRVAADTVAAASLMDTAEDSTARERLLWKARLGADRLRMATELLLKPRLRRG